MWQLILITVIAVLWDNFTGWRGWSVDFVLPFGAMAVLGSMPVIVKGESSGKGRVPVLSDPGRYCRMYSYDFGVDRTGPFSVSSVICAGISFLVLAGLFIFQKKSTVREFHKKLRM